MRLLVPLVVLSAITVGCSDAGTRATSDPAPATTAPPASAATSLTATPTTVPPGPDGGPGDAGPSFGTFDTDLARALVASGDEGPFFMVNLIDFRDRAVYPDGRDTVLTGREANALYDQSGMPRLIAGGMRVAFAGNVVDESAGSEEVGWEQAAIARYPSYRQFFEATGTEEFQAGSIHKDAGVERSTVIVTHRIDNPPTAADLPVADAPVALVEVFAYDGEGTTSRPKALTDYLDRLASEVSKGDGVPLGTYDVVGVLIGDGRSWDEVHVTWFADRAALDAARAGAEPLVAARDEAIDDMYSLVVDGVLVEPFGRQP